MKVKMLRNPGKDLVNDPEFKLKEGDVGTVKKDLGEKLVKLGVAEPAGGDDSESRTRSAKADADEGDTKKDIKAVPQKATVAEPKPDDFNKLKR